MFEITVFSNPVTALVGEGGFLHGDDLARTARYDEELVKPALLLADRVNLRSHRIDLISNEIRDHNMLRFPVPMLSRSIGISTRSDPEECALLGIRPADLLTKSQIAEVRSALSAAGSGGSTEESWGRVLDMVEPFRIALSRYFRAQGESMESTQLKSLSGIITQAPWDPTPKTQPQKILDDLEGENAEFERAYFKMVDDVANSPMSVMMDDTVYEGVVRLGTSTMEFDSAVTLAGAVKLMQMVDGLSELPIDEISGVRDDLGAYLRPFRSFLLEASGNTPHEGASNAERSRQLVLTWEREVQPAVDELEGTLRSATFIRNAIDVFTDSGEVLRSVGVAVGAAVGAGFVGLSTLTAGVAIAPPLLKAFVSSVRAKQSVQTDRAYFVHAMKTRVARSRG